MTNNKMKTRTLIALSLLAAVIHNAHAAPDVLPTPLDLPTCNLGLPTQAKAVFPCSAIVAPQNDADIVNAVQQAGANVALRYVSVDGAVAIIPDQNSLDALEGDGRLSIIPNRRMSTVAKAPGKGGGTPTSTQTVPAGVQRIGAAPGMLPASGMGIGVAVVDTGIDFGHADLAVRPDCFDAFNGNCGDANGHGTHVGGIVAALNNNVDVVGVAPDAALYAVRVLDAQGFGSDATILAGLDWVAQNGANLGTPIRVVNMSLGRPGYVSDNPVLHDMIKLLTGQLGITVVVAAGNDPNADVSQQIPAAYAEVISVASTTAVDGQNACRYLANPVVADTASFFTTDGQSVTISAPGAELEDVSRRCTLSSTGILSLKAGGGTTRMNGTSMATPHVAGVVALLLQQQAYTPEAVRLALQTSASRLGVAPMDSPAASYTFDGVREGVVSACGILGVTCP